MQFHKFSLFSNLIKYKCNTTVSSQVCRILIKTQYDCCTVAIQSVTRQKTDARSCYVYQETKQCRPTVVNKSTKRIQLKSQKQTEFPSFEKRKKIDLTQTQLARNSHSLRRTKKKWWSHTRQWGRNSTTPSNLNTVLLLQ